MINAKKELLDHVKGKVVVCVSIWPAADCDYGDYFVPTISGALSIVLPALDFEYDDGYGGQNLEGFAWYEDGSWSERREYDGSEWWHHCQQPALPDGFPLDALPELVV